MSRCSVGEVAARHVAGGEGFDMGRWWLYEENSIYKECLRQCMFLLAGMAPGS